MKYLILSLMFYGLSLQAQPEGEIEAPLQQQNVNTEEQTKSKLGVKFTTGLHMFRGNAFDDEKPRLAFGTGIYNVVQLNKEKKNMHLHWELNLTFRGSKFAKQNDTSYSKIGLAYVELPVYFSFRLLNPKNNKPLHMLTGFQAGYLILSNINKNYGTFGEVKTNLPFRKWDLMPAIGLRKEIASGMSLQLCFKIGLLNNWTNTFYERSLPKPPGADINKNEDYRDLTPTFKDGTHFNRNGGIELSLLF